MSWFDIKTAIVINRSGWQAVRKQKSVAGVMPAEEIDRLDPGSLSGMSREQLVSLRKKISVTSDELYADCDPGTPEWEIWEKRMDKLDLQMDRIDEILELGTENDWEDGHEESDCQSDFLCDHPG